MFVIDIEGRGPNAYLNGIVSIGVCVGDITGVIEKRRFDLLPYDNQSMDIKCKADFWDKNPGLLEKLERNSLRPEKGIREFRHYLDEWDQKVKNSDELYIVCDTPGYDFHFINSYLDREGLQPLCMRYNPQRNDYDFRALHDADSYARGYCKQLPQDPWVSNSDLIKTYNLAPLPDTLKPHMPEDDAESIFRVHCGLVNHLRRLLVF